MSVEHLLRGRSRVGYGPMINRRLRHDSDGAFRYPLPEGDVLSISVGFDLGLGLDIEYLQCPTSCARSIVSSQSPAVNRCSARARNIHLRAKIFWCGCIIAESALIGLRRTLLASLRSIITTWFCSPTFSRTHMKWSDSRVSVCHQPGVNQQL